MVYDFSRWLWEKYRPAEGWLPLFLLLTLILVVAGGVQAVAWVPEVGVVAPTAVFGFLLATLLAKRPLSPLLAWPLLLAYGLLWPLLVLGQLFPPLGILWQGWDATTDYWRQNGFFLYDRIASWVNTVSSGGSSRETIVFALGLALLAWFLSAYVGWSAYRQRQPLLGLTLMGVAVGVNGYFGATPFIWPAAFVALTALVAAVLHFANLEQFWQQRQVDYSTEIRLELLAYAGVTAVLLLVIALLLPAFSISRLRALLPSQPAVAAAEAGLERAFEGVNQPRRDGGGTLYAPGGSGVLPRAFLLGNAPELAQTVVMHAAVTVQEAPPSNPQGRPGTHWRALSYATYTGRGWALAEERVQPLPANQPLPLPVAAAQTVYAQQVNWVLDGRIVRYTMGLPRSFDQEVVALWHGATDLVRVQGERSSYRAVSQLTTATADELKTAVLADVPPDIAARYTQLPPTVPPRVEELAQEVAGGLATPYEQARALERFLRQYAYSLTVALPPDDVDPVDYFLFELQSGYCDYYASAMTVLARSLGLPARLATGYLAQPPDENGWQRIRQLDAHSWVEVYFAGYGWVEFEPTAAFPTPHDPTTTAAFTLPLDEPVQPEPAPLPLPPQSEAKRPFPWNRLLLVGALAGLLIWAWRRQQWRGQQDGVRWAYGRLLHAARRLGFGARPGQTATEFAAGLRQQLGQLGADPRLQPLLAALPAEVERLTALFVRRQYGGEGERGELAAVAIWRRIKRPFWLLWLLKWLRVWRHG